MAEPRHDERIALVSGRDFWNTTSGPGVPSIMLTDGPHGLRKQLGSADHLGLAGSVPATCFPPAAGLGATWDPDLLEEIGVALGRESAAEQVGVLLGPGLNIKRHPAGGRNFEYLSEDPFLSGRAAAALVRGIQSQGVGACLKHFAVNNQESHRMSLDTLVDERTLREVYLAGFERAVAESQPWTVMSSYNLVNGEHVGESRRLLTEILRDEWGFDGLVMSDWLAVADRPLSIHAGLDLEMPGSKGLWDGRIAAALEDGSLARADLDTAVARVTALVQQVVAERENRGTIAVDHEAHHALARRAAAAATVLLTNDGVLPLSNQRLAVIGAFAETPRYQGAGSSLVNPTRLDTALQSFRARFGDALDYAPGYDAASGRTTAELLATARQVARDADVAVVFVGLPASYESEGFDREHLRLPPGHEALVEAVLAANDRTVVVLVNGAPVELPWADRPAALVEAYLGGQAGGSAIVDVLSGDAEPAGRLAESFPVSALELPADANFANHPTQVQYRETFHVGYRFHDTCDVAPRFCFGHGLGYTTFDLTDLAVAGDGTDRAVTVRVTNTGDRAGSTVVQLYVHDRESTLARPEQELRAFAKVHLDARDSSLVTLDLDRRSFAVYDVGDSAWKVESGDYELRVGLSSRDIRLTETIDVVSADIVNPAAATSGPIATDAEFAALLGRPVPEPRPLLPFTTDSSIADLGQTWLGGRLRAVLLAQITKDMAVGDEANVDMMNAVVEQMPLRGVAAASDGRISLDHLDRALRLLNIARRR